MRKILQLNSIPSAFLTIFVLIMILSGCEAGLVIHEITHDGTFFINNNQEIAYSREVLLQMNIEDAEEMRFCNPDGLWTNWEPYSTTKTWTLSEGTGQKTVYGEFRRRMSIEAVMKSDKITLEGENGSIATATDLGDLSYAGTKSVVVSGFLYDGDNNYTTVDDADFFSFTALDPIGGQINYGINDPKNFHVKIKFNKNPEGAYGIRVWDGLIGTGENFGEEIYGEFDWGLKTDGDILDSIVNCHSQFVIEVYQHQAFVGTDKEYELEISNGLYSTFP